jgi:hypothetical protein
MKEKVVLSTSDARTIGYSKTKRKKKFNIYILFTNIIKSNVQNAQM